LPSPNMASNEGLMADPYSSPAAPPPTLPSSANPAATVQIARPSASQPDFLFPESDYDQTFRRSWGERLTYHAGTAYLIGLTGGGIVGLGQGLRESQGERRRIRINSVLNATGRRGPLWGNSLGCVAMMGSIFESIAYNVRGEDDIFNAVGAGAVTGALYKITAGPRVAGTFALGLGAVAAAGSLVSKALA